MSLIYRLKYISVEIISTFCFYFLGFTISNKLKHAKSLIGKFNISFYYKIYENQSMSYKPVIRGSYESSHLYLFRQLSCFYGIVRIKTYTSSYQVGFRFITYV